MPLSISNSRNSCCQFSPLANSLQLLKECLNHVSSGAFNLLSMCSEVGAGTLSNTASSDSPHDYPILPHCSAQFHHAQRTLRSKQVWFHFEVKNHLRHHSPQSHVGLGPVPSSHDLALLRHHLLMNQLLIQITNKIKEMLIRKKFKMTNRETRNLRKPLFLQSYLSPSIISLCLVF